jgi:hypothetical protein
MPFETSFVSIFFKRKFNIILEYTHSCQYLILIILLLVLGLADASGQVRKGNNTIKGKVYDSETKSPIPFAVIFLKNTTVGTSADLEGKYEIKNVPSGDYEIVFSQVSYEMEAKQISLYNGITLTENSYLKQKTFSVQAMEVTGHETTEWRDNLSIFIKEFLGETANANKCKILNPEVLDFKIDPKTGEFRAFTDSIVRIENMALGYRLYLHLKRFSVDYQNYLITFQYYPRFEELKSDDPNQMEEWKNKRILCYKGSMKHLMSSIIRDRMDAEGFVLHRSENIGGLMNRMGIVIHPEDIIVKSLTDTNFYEIKFGFPCIQVDYVGISDYSLSSGKLVSYFESVVGSYTVTQYGEIVYPAEVVKSGYWSKLRMANALPLDYYYVDEW